MRCAVHRIVILIAINGSSVFGFNAPESSKVVRFIAPDSGGYDTLPPAKLKEAFAPVAGFEHRIRELRLKDYKSRERVFSRFDGLAKLSQPWNKNKVLRLTIYDIDRLKIHFWNGTSGVSLQYFRMRTPNVFGAFRATRTGTGPRPESLALQASDNGRWSRSGFGPFELWWHDGSLIASRGNVRLLTIPLEAVPTEIYFEGALSFRDLQLKERSARLKTRDKPVAKNLLAKSNAAQLSWQHDLPEFAEFVSKTESVELSVKGTQPTRNATQSVTVWTSVPEADARLSEVIFQVDDADPGTSVFLGDENGKPLHRIAYFLDRPTSWKSFGYVRQATRQLDSNYDVNTFPPPYAGHRHWLRVVLGFDFIKLWVSSDGKNWSRVGDAPISTSRGGFTTLGLYADVTDEDRRISVRHIEVRPLMSILELVRGEVRQRVPVFSSLETMDPGVWMHKTIATRPPDIALDEWRRACAIRSLQASPPKAIADPLLRGLIKAGVSLNLPIDQKLRLLDEAALIMDLRNGTAAQQFIRLYGSVLDSTRQQPNPLVVDEIVARTIESPVWSSVENFPFPESVARRELLNGLEQSDWDSVQQIQDHVRFWNDSGHPKKSWWGQLSSYYQMLGWSHAIVGQFVPRKGDAARAAPSYNWRHPLVVDLSKEGYNVMTELDSALRAKVYNDACQIIAAAGSSDMLGLLPNKDDARLVIPFHTAVAWAMHEHPKLAGAMKDRLGSVAALRVRRAIENSDVESVKAATVQYYGTTAAAEAHGWLGDRQMSIGRFGDALQHYRKAMQQSEQLQTDNLIARSHIAAAMLGNRGDGTVKAPVTLGGTSLTPEQFEALVAQMLQKSIAVSESTQAIRNLNQLPHEHVPLPSEFDAQVKAAFEGEYGQHPERVRTSEYDWVAQQLGIANDAATLYISNRFQIAGHDINTGARKWVTGLAGEQGEAHQVSFMPMRPLLVGNKLFARRIEKKGPELVCLNRPDGKLLWRARPTDHVSSDPVWIHNKLLALVSTFPQSGFVNIEAVQFDPNSGEVVQRWPMARCNDVWGRRPPLQLMAVDDQIVATVPGLVFSFSPAGKILWIRKQTWMPPQADSRQIEQTFGLPLHSSGQMCLIQPASRAVECLDLKTGRRVWSCVVPEVRRIVGITAQHVITETRFGFQAIDRQRGRLSWNLRADRLLNGRMCSASGPFVYSQWVQMGKNKRNPMIVWVDTKTGTEIGRSVLHQVFDKDPRFGPMLPLSDRMWCFFGRGPKDPRRDLIELKVTAARYPNSFVDARLSRWMPALPSPLLHQVESIIPGWRTFAVNQPKDAGVRAEFRGQNQVLAMQLQPARPVNPDVPPSRKAPNWVPDHGAVRMFRCVDVPEDGNLKLTLRAGHDSGASWRLCIDANHQEVLRQDIDDKTAPNGWKDISVDLKDYAGQKVWLTMAEVPRDVKKRQFAYIHQLKLIR